MQPCSGLAQFITWNIQITWGKSKSKTFKHKKHDNHEHSSYSKLYNSFRLQSLALHSTQALLDKLLLQVEWQTGRNHKSVIGTTFWNNILPLMSYISGWGHPVGQRCILWMCDGWILCDGYYFRIVCIQKCFCASQIVNYGIFNISSVRDVQLVRIFT